MAGFTTNMIVVSGNLTRDPELRYIPSGTPVLSFSMAVNNRKKVGDQWQDDPCFVGVTVWDKAGEALAEQITKGSRVVVAGRIQQRNWEKDGQKRSVIEIVADQVHVGAKVGGGRASREPGSDDMGDTDVPF